MRKGTRPHRTTQATRARAPGSLYRLRRGYVGLPGLSEASEGHDRQGIFFVAAEGTMSNYICGFPWKIFLMGFLIIAIMVSGVLGIIYADELISTSVVVVELDLYSGILPIEGLNTRASCFVVAQRDEWWYAVTASHFINPGDDLTVDAEQYPVEIVRIDSEEDVALVRFKSPETYRIYTFASAVVGESCVTVGWAGEEQVRMVYKGHVVALGFQGKIVSNCGVVPGCSGGALFNAAGEVIGVTVMAPIYRCIFDSTIMYVPARFAAALVMTIGGE